MNDDSETQITADDHEETHSEGDRSDPPSADAMEAAAAEAQDPDDDRDVRVPRASDDDLAEAPVEAEASMEDEIRRMAAEPPQEEVAAEASPGDQEPPLVTEEPVEDDPEERQMTLEAAGPKEVEEESPGEPAVLPPPPEVQAATPAKPTPATPMASAHEAFAKAITAHAKAKGLELIPQTSYLQLLHRPTGHKVYVASAVKTQRVHIETTLPIVGVLGASVPKKDNGRIQAVMDPAVDNSEELMNVISLIDILASGQHGPLPSPKRRTLPA